MNLEEVDYEDEDQEEFDETGIEECSTCGEMLIRGKCPDCDE